MIYRLLLSQQQQQQMRINYSDNYQFSRCTGGQSVNGEPATNTRTHTHTNTHTGCQLYNFGQRQRWPVRKYAKNERATAASWHLGNKGLTAMAVAINCHKPALNKCRLINCNRLISQINQCKLQKRSPTAIECGCCNRSRYNSAINTIMMHECNI